MGLMDFRPFLAVSVNGMPLAAGPFSAISSARVTDASGFDSDTCEIAFASGGLLGGFAMPDPGAEIAIAMGSGFSLRPMGLFVADEVEESAPPNTIMIVGRAKAQGETQSGWAPINQQKTRSWPDDLTIDDIVSQIAGENGLEPGATESAGAIVPGHIDQIDESDMAMLTRLAARHDLVAKPAGGVLFVGRKGEGITASGGQVPTVPIFRPQVTRWSMRRSLGEAVGSIVATWRDLDAATDNEVTVGEGEPVRRLRSRFRSEAEAQEAAEAEQKRATRAKESLEVTMPGNAAIAADGKILALGLSAAASGLWIVKTVTHSITAGGFTTDFSAERPAD